MGSCISLSNHICYNRQEYIDQKLSEAQILEIKNSTKDSALEFFPDFTYGKVVDVYDGDTITVNTMLNNIDQVFQFKIRLYGINCPEIKGGTIESKRLAKKAKKYVVDRALDQMVKIEIMSGKFINNKLVKDPFGRIIAKVYLADYLEKDLSTELLEESLAKQFMI